MCNHAFVFVLLLEGNGGRGQCYACGMRHMLPLVLRQDAHDSNESNQRQHLLAHIFRSTPRTHATCAVLLRALACLSSVRLWAVLNYVPCDLVPRNKGDGFEEAEQTQTRVDRQGAGRKSLPPKRRQHIPRGRTDTGRYRHSLLLVQLDYAFPRTLPISKWHPKQLNAGQLTPPHIL